MKVKYFNFPVTLLQGFMINSKSRLDDIMAYNVYVHSDQEGMDESEVFDYLNLSRLGDGWDRTFDHGRLLYSHNKGQAMTGFSVETFWEYYKNPHSTHDKITLLAFLAVKSIVGHKEYVKVTNQNLIYSRMAGYSKIRKTIPKDILEHCTRYKFGKIKLDLKEHYKVAFYSYHTRGQYISTKLDYKKLCSIAEQKKLSGRMKRVEQWEKECRNDVLGQISEHWTYKK